MSRTKRNYPKVFRKPTTKRELTNRVKYVEELLNNGYNPSSWDKNKNIPTAWDDLDYDTRERG